jgi:hypothetical protein
MMWRPCLAELDDDLVFECAMASSAEHIVTHNLRHFGGGAKGERLKTGVVLMMGLA